MNSFLNWTFGRLVPVHALIVTFPAGDHKAPSNRQDSMANTSNKMIHKISTTLERSVRKLLEGLNIFGGTNLTPISDVDQGTYMFGSSYLDNYQN